MNKHLLAFFYLLGVLYSSGTFAEQKDHPMKIKLNTPFELSVGEKAELTAEGLSVSLDKLGETPIQGAPPGGAEVFPVALATLTITKGIQTKSSEISQSLWLAAYGYLVFFDELGKKVSSAKLRIVKSKETN